MSRKWTDQDLAKIRSQMTYDEFVEFMKKGLPEPESFARDIAASSKTMSITDQFLNKLQQIRDHLATEDIIFTDDEVITIRDVIVPKVKQPQLKQPELFLIGCRAYFDHSKDFAKYHSIRIGPNQVNPWDVQKYVDYVSPLFEN